MDVTAATNERTTIATVTLDAPCGHSAPILKTSRQWDLVAILNSYTFDFLARIRCAGLHLTWFLLEEIVIPNNVPAGLARTVLSLTGIAPSFAGEWLELGSNHLAWRQNWSITEYERLRRRCILDAAVAASYGLSSDDLRHILRDCDRSAAALTSKPFTRTLDPKAFWRAEKEKPPELRQTVLTQIAFQELERVGIAAFLALNDGEGWMLPEKLRLADYGLGHDDRAKEYQPVASVLGPRFYDWQLAQSIEESWEECERHAELLSRIVPPRKPTEEPQPVAVSELDGTTPTDLFGEPIPTDLFGNPVYTRKRR